MFITSVLAFALAGQAATSPKPPEAVSKAAFSANVDKMFAAIDTSKDGYITAAEVEAAQMKEAQVALAQYRQLREQAFKKMDANNDGNVTLAEWTAARPDPTVKKPDASKLMGRADTNKDGKISRDEYRVRPMGDFDKLDKNKDGAIDAKEQAAARK